MPKRSTANQRPRSVWLWLLIAVVALWAGSRMALFGRIMEGESAAPTARAEFTADSAAQRVGPCRVLRVIDGDTLDVDCPGMRERVRLLRVDTPEREQPGYAAAKAALLALIGDSEIYLDYEQVGEQARSKHGRVLAYLFVGERNLNVELVRMGWTPFYDLFGPGRFAPDFEAAEREARNERRGLWGMRALRTR